MKGYFDGDRDFNGEFSGALRWGVPAGSAPRAGTLPVGKLSCVFQERVGGVVAGDLANYQTRTSALGTLTLEPGGAYRAQNGAGALRAGGRGNPLHERALDRRAGPSAA